jgi:hypothetical protein
VTDENRLAGPRKNPTEADLALRRAKLDERINRVRSHFLREESRADHTGKSEDALRTWEMRNKWSLWFKWFKHIVNPIKLEDGGGYTKDNT